MIDNEKVIIAKRAVQELKDGDVVNLGIGIPTMVADYLPEAFEIEVHSENGGLGLGPAAKEGEVDQELTNAGSVFCTYLPGACFFDSATSFAIIRGGHLDVTMLGAMEVDEKGNLANYKIPGKKVTGMGGAMDLVKGAKRVIITMTHTTNGKPKILKECKLPLTAKGEVDRIITEMAVIDVTNDGLVLRELGPGVTIEQVINATDAKLIIPEKIGHFGDMDINNY